MTNLRIASHGILYAVAHSNAMNGIAPGTIITYTTPAWRTGLMIANVAIGALLVAGAAWVVVRNKKNKAAEAQA